MYSVFKIKIITSKHVSQVPKKSYFYLKKLKIKITIFNKIDYLKFVNFTLFYTNQTNRKQTLKGNGVYAYTTTRPSFGFWYEQRKRVITRNKKCPTPARQATSHCPIYNSLPLSRYCACWPFSNLLHFYSSLGFPSCVSLPTSLVLSRCRPEQSSPLFSVRCRGSSG